MIRNIQVASAEGLGSRTRWPRTVVYDPNGGQTWFLTASPVLLAPLTQAYSPFAWRACCPLGKNGNAGDTYCWFQFR